MCTLLFVIPNPDIMARWTEGAPRNVEPAVAGQELVGIRAGAEEVHQTLELARILGADVGSLTKQMLRVLDTTDKRVDARIAEAGIDDDRANHLSGWLQQHQATVGHVCHVLHGGLVVGVLTEVAELA